MSKERERFRLWKHPNGTWYVATGSGAKSQRVSAETKNRGEAEEFRAQFIELLKNPAPPPTSTIKHYLKLYMDMKGPETQSPETIGYHVPVLTEFFGNLLPSNLSRQTLKDYVEWRRKRKKRRGSILVDEPVSNGTILREIGTLKAALHFAHAMRWIPAIPEFDAPCAKPAPRQNWLKPIQVKKLIDHAKSPHIKLFIQTALATAARSGAILELTWDNIDFEHNLIDFGYGHGNKRRNVLPMNAELLESMKFAYSDYLARIERENDKASRRRKNKTPRETCRRVVTFGNQPIKSTKGAFRRLTNDCGIIATPHVIRHTAATWMVMAGVPLSKVAKLLGDTEETVERVYGKYSPDFLKEAVDSLNINHRLQVNSK